jgi:TonB family protein
MPVGFGRADRYIKAVTDRPPIEPLQAAPIPSRELDLAAKRQRDSRWWLAVAAAVALHLSPALLLLKWPHAAPAAPPAAIPVSLVMQQPPTAPPPPPAKPAPPDNAPRRSGRDQTTTAPPQGEATATQEDAEPAPPTPPPAGMAPFPGSGPQAAMLVPGTTSPRPVEKPSAPVRAPPARKRADPPKLAAIGSSEMNGDPYLNVVMDDILRHLSYPEITPPVGRIGAAVYYIQIDRSGHLQWLDLVASTGRKILDAAAEKGVRASGPFPPPPARFVGLTLRLELSMVPE